MRSGRPTFEAGRIWSGPRLLALAARNNTDFLGWLAATRLGVVGNSKLAAGPKGVVNRRRMIVSDNMFGGKIDHQAEG